MGILNKITGKKEEAAEKKPAATRAKNPDVSGPRVKSVKSDFAARILVRPIVSEKSTHAEADKKYSFFVAKNATKVDVKRAVKEVYGVLPLKVNMIVGEGKVKTMGRRTGRRNDYKKAIVTVAKNLDIHEGV